MSDAPLYRWAPLSREARPVVIKGFITHPACESSRSPINSHENVSARERMLESSVQAPVAILRPSLIYGASDPHNGYGPNRFRRTADQDGKITLFGQGEEQRDHVFIDDVAEIVGRVLSHRSRGVLNLVTGRSVSFGEVAAQIAREDEGRVEIENRPRSGPITHRHFDPAALLKAFPTFRPTPIEEGLRRVQRQVRPHES